jgi:glycosyltransferase involved in cell wall biosynthesis
MKILLMTQYFYPEPGATPNRLISFAREFSRKGHELTVLSEFPCYPTGKLPRQYRFKLFKSEYFENFKIIRTFVLPTARSNIITRLFSYASFFLSSFLASLLLRRPDIIIVSSPPPTVGASAALISKIKGVPLVGDIQDLWPEYAIAIGKLRNRVIIYLCRLTERIFYQNCIAMVTISEGLKDYLAEYTNGKKQIYIIRNGSSFPDDPLFYKKQSRCFSQKTITVCYAGVIGLLQPIQDIIKAAEITLPDKTIRYLIVGDGVNKKRFENQVITKELSNVTFKGVISQDETNRLLLKSDIGIVTLLDIDQFKSALPSKFFDYMAVGLPVILGVDGEARKILETNNTGVYYKPGNPDTLVEKIRYLQDNPDIARSMGCAGRKLVLDEFSRSKLSSEMEELISHLVE